jgi:hypothetical protein
MTGFFAKLLKRFSLVYAPWFKTLLYADDPSVWPNTQKIMSTNLKGFQVAAEPAAQFVPPRSGHKQVSLRYSELR